MFEQDKNWRGLPVHAVDEWDSWHFSLAEYEELRLTYDMLVLQGTDMELVLRLMEFSTRARMLEEADLAAGEDI